MKKIVYKIFRRLKKEVKLIRKRINPKIEIPLVDYKTNLTENPNVAIIGLGPQGHKLALYLHNMGYNIVALCDLNKKRLSSLSKKIPKATPCTDIEKLKDLRIDICIIATLADSHLNLIRKVSSIGIKKILCEKPITNSIAHNYELKKVVEEEKIQLEVYHPALFSEDSREFKNSISLFNKGNFLKGNIFFKPGGIGNIGSHVFSTFLFLTDIKIDSVISASLSETDGTSRGKYFFDPNGKICFKTRNNKKIIVENSKQLNFKAQKILLEFENCYVNFYDGKKLIIKDKKNLNSDRELIAKYPVNTHLGRYRCIDNAIKNLLNKKESLSLQYSINAIELIIGGHLSYKKNKEIVFPLEVNSPRVYNFS